jgi:hypothetical protein
VGQQSNGMGNSVCATGMFLTVEEGLSSVIGYFPVNQGAVGYYHYLTKQSCIYCSPVRLQDYRCVSQFLHEFSREPL